MKKITKIIPLTIITILLMTISVFAADFAINANVEKQDKEYTLRISLGDLASKGTGITGFICDLEYDKEVFETVDLEDITAKNGWEDLTYNPEKGAILVLRINATNQIGEDILEIKLHEKENAKSGNTEIKITNIQATNSENDLEADDTIVSLKIDGEGSVLKTILIVILVIVIILFILRLIVRTQVKRRKRR